MNSTNQQVSSDSSKTICFQLGQLIITPAALDLLARMAVNAAELIQRHQRGEWGCISAEDAVENENAIVDGLRILSSYQLGDECIWIITEADRSATTLLLPEEY